MRRFLVPSIGVAALLTCATALAALPKSGARYAGVTSAPSIGKFKDPVTFRASKDSRKLMSINFGEPSCQGSGGPPPSKNPYKSVLAVKLGSATVSAKGKFSVTKTTQLFGRPAHSTFKGTFKRDSKTRKTLAKGSIVLTQDEPDGTHCGPAQLTFRAAPK
jgi:hypothetical protein